MYSDESKCFPFILDPHLPSSKGFVKSTCFVILALVLDLSRQTVICIDILFSDLCITMKKA